ncbi:hypothetical protein CCICO_06725 [Corynebacterium ciconiae DSM 44920]|uniref:DUF3093 domain-containing protein n=1 Tax=Corynebacterium ciconiae TaxID=227319 RepID=UPI0003768951|nr:hypothetical protein CCICO_06725 [Corynebacterium ciconiae DSM 44920]
MSGEAKLDVAIAALHSRDVTTSTEKRTAILYRERQWVPWYWWALALAMVTVFCLQLMFNRNVWWFIIPEIILGAAVIWYLWWMSSTTVVVEEDADGVRWLSTDGASLPHTVVDRSLAVPASAKQNAMGRQLDPAAYLVSHGWVPQMVMLVLDDPDDPTPYWLIGAKDPAAVLSAFVPDQADTATAALRRSQS